MEPTDVLLILAAGVLLAAAAAIDLRRRRIPNWLTLPAITLGALATSIRCLYGYPVWAALLTTVTVLVITYLLWLTGCWGGGDAKACLGVLFLVSPAFPELYFAAIFSGCLALLLIARHTITGKEETARRPLGHWLFTAYILSAMICIACFGGLS